MKRSAILVKTGEKKVRQPKRGGAAAERKRYPAVGGGGRRGSVGGDGRALARTFTENERIFT